MPPITVHNLPVAPREVALAFECFNAYLRKFTTDRAEDDQPNFQPTEVDYCAILYDDGAEVWMHRIMVIEWNDEGYTVRFFVHFEDGVLKSLAFLGDDNDAIEIAHPYKEETR